MRTCAFFIFQDPSAFGVMGFCGLKRESLRGSAGIDQDSPPETEG